MLIGLHSRYNRKVIEQAAIAGVLRSQVTSDPENANRAAEYIARRLDALADETERGWSGAFNEHGFHFERTLRGVKEIDDANTIFDELMGDKVEPRRVFIEEHALSASVDV